MIATVFKPRNKVIGSKGRLIYD